MNDVLFDWHGIHKTKHISIDDLSAFCPADSASSKENKDEEEKTYGMGGAMGMLSSLTTAVQSTVRAS